MDSELLTLDGVGLMWEAWYVMEVLFMGLSVKWEDYPELSDETEVFTMVSLLDWVCWLYDQIGAGPMVDGLLKLYGRSCAH